jgi:nucleotide-binding universal stress UspA family protein
MGAKAKDQPILVPVDFSAYSAVALEHGADLAEALKVSLLVLHVVHDLGEAPGYYAVKGRGKQLRRMEDVASDMLNEFLHEARKKHPKNSALGNAETALVVGLPVNRILEVAKKSGASMIVMGSQGRTGLAHALLGSKAEQVVHLSPIPVTIIKADKAADKAADKKK